MLRSMLIALTAAVLLAHVQPAFAIQDQLLPDEMLIPVPASQLRLEGTRGLRGATAFIVPTVLIYLSVEGSVRASAMTVRSSNSVTGEYAVLGMRKDFTQEIARHVQTEMQRHFQTIGVTPVLFESVRRNPSYPGNALLAIDTAYGAPTVRETAPRATYAVTAPSDSQLVSGAPQRKHTAFADLARATQSVVLIPEFYFSAPQSDRNRPGRGGVVNTGMVMANGMDLMQASLTFITPTGATGSISLGVSLPAVAEAAGSLVETGSDSSHFGQALRPAELAALADAGIIGAARARVGGGQKSAVHSFDFVINEGDYTVGVLRGAMSFLKAALQVVDRDRR